MTRCLTAAVLAAALLAVLGYRRGREMAEPSRSVGVSRRLRFTHSLTACDQEPGELSPLRHLSMGFLQRHPERARCETAPVIVAASPALQPDPYLALIEHVATRRWRSPYCPECVAAEAAGLR